MTLRQAHCIQVPNALLYPHWFEKYRPIEGLTKDLAELTAGPVGVRDVEVTTGDRHTGQTILYQCCYRALPDLADACPR